MPESAPGNRKNTDPPSPKSGVLRRCLTPIVLLTLLALLAACFMAGLMFGQGKRSDLVNGHEVEVRRLKDEHTAAERLLESRKQATEESLATCLDDKRTYQLEAAKQCAPEAVERLSAAETPEEFSSSYEVDFSLGQEIRLPSTSYRVTLQDVIRNGDLLSARMLVQGTGTDGQVIELSKGASASIGRLTIRPVEVDLVKVKLAVGVARNS